MTTSMNIPTLSLKKELLFRIKSQVLIARSWVRDLIRGEILKYRDEGLLREVPVVGVSESELWNRFDIRANRILTAGKIENLRIASRYLNGIEVPAGAVFSFWKHLGRPTRVRGFVKGREIREGCLVPVTGGGLCQLSNALYDAALKAGFTIVERHKHSKVVKGSLAEQNRDATVKWNYLDLKFSSEHSFRIEIVLTSGKLVVSFRSREKNSPAPGDDVMVQTEPDSLQDCMSCGTTSCHKEAGTKNVQNTDRLVTFLVDTSWPEYTNYVNEKRSGCDCEIHSRSFIAIRLKRALLTRVYSKLGLSIPALQLKLDASLARRAARQIPLSGTHLVVSQNLVPELQRLGVFGGRTYEVLMTRLPFRELQKTLDEALDRHPESITLGDFRVGEEVVRRESEALMRAGKIVSPHEEIYTLFPEKTEKLCWSRKTETQQRQMNGRKILFPASALGRKGAFEMRRLAQELKLELVIIGTLPEGRDFWKGISAAQAGEDVFQDIALVVYPAWVEQEPRVLLRALERGIPVIATTACGLPPQKNLTLIRAGDYASFKAILLSLGLSGG